MIALAGSIAEQLRSDPYVSGLDIMDDLECGRIELSATDADMAGDYTLSDIEE